MAEWNWRCWQLGNEQYGIWERSFMSPAMFAEEVEAMIPGIRQHYPNAIIMVLGQELGSTPPASTKRPQWRPCVLDRVGNLVDLLAMQIYCMCPTDLTGDAKQAKMIDEAAWLTGQLDNAVADVRRRGLDVGVGLSEWGFWTRGAHYQPRFDEPQDIQHGLFVASVLSHCLNATPAVQFTNYYHLLAGMGLFAVQRDHVKRGLVADVFRLYRDALPGRPLAVDVESPATLDDHPALLANALETDTGRVLLLVNRDPHSPIGITVAGAATGAGTCVSGTIPEDTTGMTGTVEPGDGPLILPPLSITRTKLH